MVAAEDTRRLRRLAADLGVRLTGRVVRYDDATEAAGTPGLVDALTAGRTVLLITDGGMPSVSDPGYRLVAAAVAAGVPVTALPGPSAVTTALALSGLPSDRFCFEGFLPRRPGERRRALAALRDERRTLVLFEAPHRLAATLADAAEILGPDRPAAACREMTKTYEEVRRGPLAELAAWAADGVRGEITLVVGGAPPAVPTPTRPRWPPRSPPGRPPAPTARPPSPRSPGRPGCPSGWCTRRWWRRDNRSAGLTTLGRMPDRTS